MQDTKCEQLKETTNQLLLQYLCAMNVLSMVKKKHFIWTFYRSNLFPKMVQVYLCNDSENALSKLGLWFDQLSCSLKRCETKLHDGLQK